MNDCMTFPDTVEEFMEQYKVVDTEHIYTNGSELVPIFRMKQWFEHLPSAQPDTTTHDSIPAETGKNGGDRTSGDCISRTRAIDALKEKVFRNLTDEFYGAMQVLDELPSAQPETAKRIVGKSRDGMTLWYQCDTCNEPVDAQDNYCRGCGRRLIDETD